MNNSVLFTIINQPTERTDAVSLFAEMSLVAREMEVWEMPTRRRIWIGLNSTSPGIKFDLLDVRVDGNEN